MSKVGEPLSDTERITVALIRIGVVAGVVCLGLIYGWVVALIGAALVCGGVVIGVMAP